MERIYDMIVVGAGPAGCTAALYAARGGLTVLMLEKLSAGGQMTQTHLIENYPGFADGVDGFTLAENMERQAKRFGAEVRSAQVHALHLHQNPKAVETDGGIFYAKTIVYAAGAVPKSLGLPGEQALVGRGLSYCAACDGMFYRGKTVVVVGGGNTAAADALLLSRVAAKVILVHRRDRLRADRLEFDRLRQAANVELRLNSEVTEFLAEQTVTGVRVRNNVTGAEEIVACDGVFLCVGRSPETTPLNGQLKLDAGGYIAAGEDTRTSIPGVYAAGDCRAKALRQIITAAADGAAAVHSAMEDIPRLGGEMARQY